MGNAAPDGRASGHSASAEEPATVEQVGSADNGAVVANGPNGANGAAPANAEPAPTPAGSGDAEAADAAPAPAGSGEAAPADSGDGVAATKVSKAGRDLRAAIAVGVGLGAVVLVSLLTVRELFIGIVAAAIVVATIELAGALRRAANIEVALVPVLIGGQAMVWLSWPLHTTGIFVAFVLTVLGCLVWRFRGGSANYLRDVTASILTLTYVAMFASFAAMLVEPRDGTDRVLCFLIVVVCSDIGGYVAGVLFGKHPMAPSISPKKSWEGLAGSLVAGIIGGALSVVLLLHGAWYLGVPFGVALVATATGGDLVESLIKRDLGIKDMGNLLPGHGGLMDRMDSLLPSAVAAWMLLTLFVPA
jgi:phosphatidate cytidylyltransferase